MVREKEDPPISKEVSRDLPKLAASGAASGAAAFGREVEQPMDRGQSGCPAASSRGDKHATKGAQLGSWMRRNIND